VTTPHLSRERTIAERAEGGEETCGPAEKKYMRRTRNCNVCFGGGHRDVRELAEARTPALRGFLIGGQEHGERGAFAGFADDVEKATVALYNALNS
jgi:hypothetical protein